MKKFLIWYIVFSVILFFALYALTLYQTVQRRSLEYFGELVDEVVETRNADGFMRYQTTSYQLNDSFQTIDYDVLVYQGLTEGIDGDIHHMVVFLIPRHDTIPYAESLDDPDDQMALTFNEGETMIYQSDEDERYEGRALSYGFNVIGLVYYDVLLDQTYDGTLTLYDYEGTLILAEDVMLEVEAFDLATSGFDLGMTQAEKDDVLDINAYVRDELLTNISLFLVVDILVGGIIYFVIKRFSLKVER
ncbi:MAG TPA: hypothetical protein DHV05_05005 [Acholeplasmataceae bacterium]|nr:hypothetical protein [Acholeplasmataceae bacterium]